MAARSACPFYGALVTNCDLDTRRAKGLSQHSAGGRTAWLHVSAGLGTSPYAPIRFACPPEATLLTLTSISGRLCTSRGNPLRARNGASGDEAMG